MPLLKAKIAGGSERDRLDRLQIGTAGQLFSAGKIERLLPAEETQAYRAAKPRGLFAFLGGLRTAMFDRRGSAGGGRCKT